MYGKIFASLWDGTIATRWPVWSTFVFMIANCGPDGVIDMTQEAISARTGIPLDEVSQATNALEAPDPRSRTRDFEGRRIERLDPERDWGWRILNYGHYRGLVDAETRRSQDRKRQRSHRDRSRKVTPSHARSRQAEGEAEVEAVAPSDTSYPQSPARSPSVTDFEPPPVDTTCALPTNVNGVHWLPKPEQLAAWEAAFPAIDVPATMLEMRAWLLANPTKRKTLGGMARFVNTWLSREQDKP